jgi:hypothetical protein
MKKLITLFAASMMLLSVGAQANSCPDDPRLDDVRSLIKAVKKGENIEPMQMQYGTFLAMNDKIKAFIGGGEGNPNFKIVDGNCEQPIIIDGEMITKYEMPLDQIIKHLLLLQEKGDSDGIDDLIKNVKPYDEPVDRLYTWMTEARNSTFGKELVCQLTDAGVLKVGMAINYGSSRTYTKNCTKDEWHHPFKIDLFTGLGGQIIGKNHMFSVGAYIAQGWHNNHWFYLQDSYEQNGVEKSYFYQVEKAGNKTGFTNALTAFIANLQRLGAGIDYNTWNPADGVWEQKRDIALARHNATMAGSDELGEDDGSEKE